MREKSLVVKGGCIDFNVNRVCDQGRGRVARAVVVSMDEFIVVGYVSDYATFGRRGWTAGGVLTSGWVDRRKEKENCGMKTEIESLNQLVTSLEKLMHGGSGDDVKI
jgi:hypothetical protein